MIAPAAWSHPMIEQGGRILRVNKYLESDWSEQASLFRREAQQFARLGAQTVRLPADLLCRGDEALDG
jgi:hypothetical protein